MKFGAEGVQVLAEVRKLPDAKALQGFLQAVRTATALDDLRPLLPAPPPAP